MSQIKIAYECKFCHRPGVAYGEDEDGMFHIEKWKPALACNRCADYYSNRRSMFERIGRACHALKIYNGNKRFELIEKLTNLTKKLAQSVCDHFVVEYVWDKEFVDMLSENPDKWWKICSRFCRTIEDTRTRANLAK